MLKFLQLFIVILPWSIKRKVLIKFWKYELHPSAKIGIAYVFPKKLIMEEKSKIAHFTTVVHLTELHLGYKSSIGRNNWITGFPISKSSKHFSHQKNRDCRLVLGKESAITKNHHIDCTNLVEIGNYTTIAGYYSQFLTHSVNILENIQDSMPISIGNYCFVGTNATILGGSILPDYSVLGAKSLLNKKFTEQYHLYGGVPAKKINSIKQDAKYFNRKSGFVF